jgi:PPK2 family polyphosphate:nucleotide phosphotransferase
MNSYIVKPGSGISLKGWPASGKKTLKFGKEDSKLEQEKLVGELQELQSVLYAEHKNKLLIVLQGMDTAGKDGTIRHVFTGVNPQGVKVFSFKVPTLEELDHDYLWRVHRRVPGKGEIVIFNRSHYEDVLAVRVHDLVAPDVWKKRYEQINNFEKMLSEEGTTIIKFFLHIDKEEQRRRIEARLDDPKKAWKFSAADVHERKYWDSYMEAYEAAVDNTSTKYAPWHVVPSNEKWYRNFIVTSVIVDALKALKMRYPAPEKGLDKIVVK